MPKILYSKEGRLVFHKTNFKTTGLDDPLQCTSSRTLRELLRPCSAQDFPSFCTKVPSSWRTLFQGLTKQSNLMHFSKEKASGLSGTLLCLPFLSLATVKYYEVS